MLPDDEGELPRTNESFYLLNQKKPHTKIHSMEVTYFSSSLLFRFDMGVCSKDLQLVESNAFKMS